MLPHELHTKICRISVAAAETSQDCSIRGADWNLAQHHMEGAARELDLARQASDFARRLSPPLPPGYRKGGWVQTKSGRQFWPMDPRAEDVTPEDVAYHLAGKFRYGGASRLTVAEHSMGVARMAMVMAEREGVDPKVAGAVALLHDADEAYLPDVPRPIKSNIPGWMQIEQDVRQAVLHRFNLGYVDYQHTLISQQCDEHALYIEVDSMHLDPEGRWDHIGKAPDPEVRKWYFPGLEPDYSCEEAYVAFLRMLRELLPKDVMKNIKPSTPPPSPEPIEETTEAKKPGGAWAKELTAAQPVVEDPRVARNKARLED